MTSTADALFKVELQGAGDNPGAWHTPLNDAMTQIVEGIAAQTSVSCTGGGTITLTDTQYVSNQARSAGFNFTGVLPSATTIVAPDRKHKYYLRDSTTRAGFALYFKVSGGAQIELAAGYVYIVALDGAGSLRILASNFPYFVALSGTNAYTGNLAYTPAAFHAGMEFNVTFPNANTTTAVTISFNGQTAISLYKDGATNIAVSDISSGMAGKVLLTAATTGQLFFPRPGVYLGLTDGGVKTVGFTAAVNTRYTCAFTANGTITLPASATQGDIIYLGLGGAWTYTLNPNGLKINSSTSSLAVPGNQSLFLTYTSATDGWG